MKSNTKQNEKRVQWINDAFVAFHFNLSRVKISVIILNLTLIIFFHKHLQNDTEKLQ